MSAIDISRYQGAVDFNAVKSAGVGIVIAKLGGGDAGQYLDTMWTTNRAGVRAAGLKLGSYYFNGPAGTPAAAADFHFNAADWHPGELVVIDVEGSGIAWSVSEVIEWVNRMLLHGVPASSIGVYMSASVVNNYNWGPVAALGTFLWVASYGANTGQPGTTPAVIHWPGWALWQYTSNGSVAGVPGRVDVSQIAPSFSSLNITPLTTKGLIDMGVLTLHPVTNATQAGQPWMVFNEVTCSYILEDQNGHDNWVAAGVAEGPPMSTSQADQLDSRRAGLWPAPLLAGFNATTTNPAPPTPVPALVDLSPVLAQLAALEATLTKGYTFNVKPAA